MTDLSTFFVFHRKTRMDYNHRYNTSESRTSDDSAIAVMTDHYDQVAIVTTENLFDLHPTTSKKFTGNWIYKDGVCPLPQNGIVPNRLRQTAVGDLILDMDNNKLYFIAITCLMDAQWVA